MADDIRDSAPYQAATHPPNKTFLARLDMRDNATTNKAPEPTSSTERKKKAPSKPARPSAVPTTPVGFLRLALQRIPALWWAVGVGALIAVVAIVHRWNVPPLVAILGPVALFVGMVSLVVFANLVSPPRAIPRPPTSSLLMLWTLTILMLLAAVLSFTSLFFNTPLPIRSMLVGKPTTEEARSAPPQPALDFKSFSVDRYSGGAPSRLGWDRGVLNHAWSGDVITADIELTRDAQLFAVHIEPTGAYTILTTDFAPAASPLPARYTIPGDGKVVRVTQSENKSGNHVLLFLASTNPIPTDQVERELASWKRDPDNPRKGVWEYDGLRWAPRSDERTVDDDTAIAPRDLRDLKPALNHLTSLCGPDAKVRAVAFTVAPNPEAKPQEQPR